jgi:hypothetical protein
MSQGRLTSPDRKVKLRPILILLSLLRLGHSRRYSNINYTDRL